MDTGAVALAWLDSIASKGITATVRKGKLMLHPGKPNPYNRLTDAETITLRHHRPEIIAAIESGHTKRGAGPLVQATTLTTSRGATPTVVPAPTPEPLCVYCGTLCVGQEHPAYRVLHWRDPQEVERRQKLATDTMLHTMKHGSGITKW